MTRNEAAFHHPAGIAFDLDGTLIDSPERGFATAEEQGEMVADLKVRTAEELAAALGS